MMNWNGLLRNPSGRKYGVRHSRGRREGFESLQDAENWARKNTTGFYEIYSYAG